MLVFELEKYVDSNMSMLSVINSVFVDMLFN